MVHLAIQRFIEVYFMYNNILEMFCFEQLMSSPVKMLDLLGQQIGVVTKALGK